MLGIIIGISAVIMITSMGQGFQASINEQFAKMGAVGLEVSVKYDEVINDGDRLTLDDVDLLQTHPSVADTAPYGTLLGKVKMKNPAETSNVYFVGTNENFKDVQGVEISKGRFLIQSDVSGAAAGIVIDSNLAKKIFGRTDAVGKTIHADFETGGSDLTVVGVYDTVDFGSSMFEMPSIAYIPITTLQRIDNGDYIEAVYVNVRDKETIDRTALEISKLLSLRHNNENKYNVQNLLQQIDSVNDLLATVTSFVGLVAAISLFVGGIGVMNIMLVTVTERTHEIGIRKSLGATNGNIRFQFLVEAMILTVIGGLVGIVLGYLGGSALGSVVDLKPVVSVPTVALTVIVSSVIGIVFGVYPAGKAAKLDPIEALRHE
jgi:putative ABC transport system permease protein